ncbi:MAG: hypothetical protein RMK29_15685 [Myxococcales bacterium]|nr:hypothetical protein [Myxococcota bacterium]MDW8283157.1 hypothetical protein [Myxococcales bacterium]
MRHLTPLLLALASCALAAWAVSCQDSPRDILPVRTLDLAPVVVDLSHQPDLLPPPDLRPDDAGDGGPIDGGDGGG